MVIQGSRLLAFSGSALPYGLRVLCLQRADREDREGTTAWPGCDSYYSHAHSSHENESYSPT